jgi:prepilin signal peptidase PulO-like enzyme (type II secretory pathway)
MSGPCVTMMLMVALFLMLIGLCLGSFVNALVWRVREQELESEKKKPDSKYLKQLSISRGRSICPHCKHELKAADLVPLLSWLSLKGKCRYCRKPIAVQYPLVELSTALLFVASYLFWPIPLTGSEIVAFGLWLLILTGLMALFVYDLRWMLLPNRIVYPLGVIAGLFALLNVARATEQLGAAVGVGLAVLVGGTIFYALFQISQGRWIGGGDVKLGWLLGLVVATPAKSLLFIFLASIIGSVVSIPLLVSKRLKSSSVIPFGPLLIVGGVVSVLFGSDIIDWYQRIFLNI